jgi:hypothetical protein
MPQPCKVCSSPHLAEIDAAIGQGATLATVATLFDVTESAAGRHKKAHLARVQVAPTAGDHIQAAEAMVAQARATRVFDAYDEAEATYLRSIAAALDAKPDNPSILHEFRVTLESFRPEKPQQTAPDEQVELAELIAYLSGPPADAWQRAFDAAVAAGVSPEVAHKVASAATDKNYDPHPPQTAEEWHVRKKEVDEAMADYRRTGHFARKA